MHGVSAVVGRALAVCWKGACNIFKRVPLGVGEGIRNVFVGYTRRVLGILAACFGVSEVWGYCRCVGRVRATFK